MATILFTWELGKGFGHLYLHRATIRALAADGHQVFFSTRDPGNAEIAFGEDPVRILPAPILPRDVATPYKPTANYAHILHNIGFDDATSLRGRLKTWLAIYDHVQPDLVIHDHSPTAQLAYKHRPCRQISAGSGFMVPPASTPFPPMFPGPDSDIKQLARDEDAILARVNEALAALQLPTLATLADLARMDDYLMLTFREIDHYGGRAGTEYLGDNSGPEHGIKPDWPAGSGKKIFAYLYPFKGIGEFLRTLAATQAACIIYAPEVRAEIKAACTSSHIRFVDKAQNMTEIAPQCDLAITNANHGTTCALLLAGKPSLMLPYTLEQLMLARRVRDIGAGLFVPQTQATPVGNKLSRLLESDSYIQAAESFAERYQNFNQQQQTDRIMEIVQGCLERN